MDQRETLLEIYESLKGHFGYRNWWPGDSQWEIIVGAILTQNVAWKNVEQAIQNLKNANKLSIKEIFLASESEIASLIKPSRYYNMKAKKLKAMASYIVLKYDSDLNKFLAKPLEELRKELLSLWGIGPETADSIILYSANLPSFVVDAYTKRIFQRLGIFPSEIAYEEMRDFFMKNLLGKGELFNDYHAQIVALGHNICKSNPLCDQCPLGKRCPRL